MPDGTTLLIDANNLAHRAFHAHLHIRHENRPVGVIFGILQDLATMGALFQPTKTVFCFDSDTSLRANEFPFYKQTRRQRNLTDPDYVKRRELITKQIEELRLEVLPALGYRNLFSADGYEADDVLASTAWSCMGDVVLVSSDSDLYQLLDATTRIYNPLSGVGVTAESLHRETGIEAHRWYEVKALAGCTSDDVLGVAGVGEKKAISYLLGKMNPKIKAHARIVEFLASPLYEQSRKLVRLPYPDCPAFTPCHDEVSADRWDRVCLDYGFTSLLGRCPVAISST
jgi:DNA polymerase-1